MKNDDIIIAETKNWIEKVVIGCNFCPFASRVVKNESVYFTICRASDLQIILTQFSNEVKLLDDNKNIETTIIILPGSFSDFMTYLHLVDMCNLLLKDLDKEGVYQIASFHPDYQFSGTKKNDPSNYTNRSVYPLIQLLREASITNVLEHYINPNSIPERNISYAREKGLDYMIKIKESCYISTE